MAKKARSGGAVTAKEKRAMAKNRRIRAAASATVKGAKGLKRKTGAAATASEVRKYLKSISPSSSTAKRLMKDIMLEVAGATRKAKKTKSGGARTAAEKRAIDKNRRMKARSGATVTKKETKRYSK